MKKFVEEFKAFISRGSVLDMAIGVIVGGAFGAITGSLVSDIITPLLAVLFNSPNTDALNITLRAATDGADPIVLGLGTFVGTIINFLVIALVLFSVIKAVNKARELAERPRRKKRKRLRPRKSPSPPPRSCSAPSSTSSRRKADPTYHSKKPGASPGFFLCLFSYYIIFIS